MKKKFEFVPRSEYSPYLQRSLNLLKKVTDKLKEIGIQSKFYTVGSGKHHLITRCIENNQKQPFDLDFNLEIDIEILPKKFKDLNLLKETIRCKFNEIIDKSKNYFQNGQDSTSVITMPLHYEDSKNIEFSFDIAIVSKNKNGDFQRLIRNKKTDNITWSQVQKSNDIESKIKELKSKNLWNKVRKTYLELKNNSKIKEPSFVCRIMAINNVYETINQVYKNEIIKNISNESLQMLKKIEKADADTKNSFRFKNLKEKLNQTYENYRLQGEKEIETYEKAIQYVFNKALSYGQDYNSSWNPYWDPVGDSAEDD